MSWAAVASTPAPAPAPAVDAGPAKRVAVLDANALIAGAGLLNLARLADRCVTTPEVLREVRDKQSRQALEALPFEIETLEPEEESVKAGERGIVRFARATGDVHALSAADVRLLALARGLEAAAHGAGRLRELPAAARVQKKRVSDAKALPGWGAEGGDWAEMDRLNREEEAAVAAVAGGGADGADGGGADGSGSRIAAAGIQQLSLGDAEGGAAGPGSASESGSEGGSDRADEQQQWQQQQGGDDDGGWQTAARTHNVARRQRRRVLRRAAREAEEAELAAQQEEEEESEWEEASGSEGEEEEEEEEEGQEEAAAGGGAGGGGGDPAAQSSISLVTADFPMQNVALQMGLRLATPDGRRISRLSKWVLRCTACTQVTKVGLACAAVVVVVVVVEMGRVFCPRCGNATLDKVQVSVGPDGAEHYGVRKKHILRGTKFALPKPKGGRAPDVILREDQLLAKAHRLRRKKAAAQELDPFAPEYGQSDAWFQAAALPQAHKGAAALLAGYKHNPNERKHVATNRRRK
eukprot:scaffold17.g508.t1